MYVDAHDYEPPSLLTQTRWDAWSLLGGVASVTLVYGVVPLLLGVFAALASAIASGPDEDAPAEPPLPIIAAEFVRLGVPPDPNRMPNRRVPIQASAPLTEEVVSPLAVPETERPEEEPPPPDAVDDPIRRLAERAQAFAELAEQRELEGDPNGVEWGTAEEARAGDIYLGQVTAYFKRGWSVPTTLEAEALRSLRAEATVQISPTLRITRFELSRSSGNPLFDQSVLDQLQRLQLSGTPLPDPPDEATASQYRGRSRVVGFDGRNAR